MSRNALSAAVSARCAICAVSMAADAPLPPLPPPPPPPPPRPISGPLKMLEPSDSRRPRTADAGSKLALVVDDADEASGARGAGAPPPAITSPTDSSDGCCTLAQPPPPPPPPPLHPPPRYCRGARYALDKPATKVCGRYPGPLGMRGSMGSNGEKAASCSGEPTPPYIPLSASVAPVGWCGSWRCARLWLPLRLRPRLDTISADERT